MNRLLLLDGATGTHLMTAGLKPGECPEKWLLGAPEHSEVLIKLQQAYIEAGSDIIYTPTFGANRIVFARHGIADQVRDANRVLSALSLEAKRRTGKANVKIAGDMSPTGLFLRPIGDTEQAVLEEVFAEQAEALKDNVDLFVVETQLSLAEARATVLGIRRVSDKPIYVTVTVDGSGKTMAGNSLPVCLISLAALGIQGFGINCSQGPDTVGEWVKEMAVYRPAGLKLICKPNAGVPTENGFSMTPDAFADALSLLPALGADIVGGCCGTSPDFIAAVKDTLSFALPPREALDVSQIACDERQIYRLSDFTLADTRITADENAEDAVFDLPPDTVARIDIEEEGQLANFVELLPMLDMPIMLGGKTAKLLEEALKLYPGKALIEPDCACPDWYIPAVK